MAGRGRTNIVTTEFPLVEFSGLSSRPAGRVSGGINGTPRGLIRLTVDNRMYCRYGAKFVTYVELAFPNQLRRHEMV